MKLSVVLPTFNRVNALRPALEGLLRQTYSDLEIIVVNDGSTDGTAALLAQLRAGRNILVINQSNRGPAAARNEGVKQAHGTYVLFTDDDCIVPADWGERFAEAIRTTNADIIGGKVHNGLPQNVWSEVSQEMTNYFVEYSARSTNHTSFLTSNNIAYRQEPFLKAGGFDERFHWAGGEERALNARILAGGGTSRFDHTIVIEHHHALTFGSFLRQQINYGRGSYLLYHFAPPETSSHLQRSPVSAYVKLLSSFFSSGIISGLLGSLLCVFAQAAVVAGMLLQAFTPEETRTSGTSS